MVGQHVDFIDHVDLEAGVRRRVDRLLQELRHFVDAAIRCRIHLDVINEATRINGDTSLTNTTRRGSDVTVAILSATIKRLGKDAGKGCFTNAAGTREQVSMMQPLLFQRVRECTNDMFLTNQSVEISRAIFACKNLIGHGLRECSLRPAFYLRPSLGLRISPSEAELEEIQKEKSNERQEGEPCLRHLW